MITPYLLPINKFSRPGKNRLLTDEIVVHYVQGPNQSARQVRKFLENRTTFGGYSYIVDDNEILQVAGIEELTPHVGGTMTEKYQWKFGRQRMHDGYSIQNWRTIGVCFCHPDTTGKPTDKTYNNLLNIVSHLCTIYKKNETHLSRHYDVTGKMCPLWFIDERRWQTFKNDVATILSMK
jgi:N-acetylmuramoyl-L-alanine amidase CwlA